MRFVRMTDLPEYMKPLLARAVQVGGFFIQVEEHDDLELNSEVHFARSGMPVHRLIIGRPYLPHGVHLLALTCRKITRYFEDSDRSIACWSATLPGPEWSEMRELTPWRFLPTAQFGAQALLVYRNVVRALSSYPVDLRVEREIAAHLPDHGKLQRAYLAARTAEFEPTLAPGLAEAFPGRIGQAIQALNVAFAEEAAEIAGVDAIRACAEAPHHKMGRRLRKLLARETEPGAPGDREVTDRWAQALGLESWYRWHPAGDG